MLTKYLEQEPKDAKSILFLLDSIYEDFDSKLSSDEKLKNLVKIYQVIGINIIVKGKLPIDEKIANIFFEIIREAVTNAIIHADSKNIKIFKDAEKMSADIMSKTAFITPEITEIDEEVIKRYIKIIVEKIIIH